tara:strand:+ start:16541 stop:16978 length:438 start_codon:yes stop_codon:yes gene_type:complete
MFTVGIDPDSQAHGVAVYDNAKLTQLHNLELLSLLDMLALLDKDDLLVSIENVCANNFVYARNASLNKNIHAKVSLSVGRCQQAQVELQRGLDRLDIPYVLHKPQKGNWAKDKSIFERITGWDNRSNEDNRSAAYFGFLAIKGRG